MNNKHAIQTITILKLASRCGHTEVINALVAARASVNTTMYRYHYRPLHLAAGNGHVGALRALLANGAEVNAMGNAWNTSLHCATEKGMSKS